MRTRKQKNDYLWKTYKGIPDEARLKQTLMTTYSSLVYYVVKSMKLPNIPALEYEDYIQFGFEGLSQAIERFNPKKGVKFETYSYFRIKGKIIDSVRGIYKSEKYAQLHSLDVDLNGDDLRDTIGDEDSHTDINYEDDEIKYFVQKYIGSLYDKTYTIMALHYYQHMTGLEIAKIVGLSPSRVSQIKVECVDQLKQLVTKHYSGITNDKNRRCKQTVAA